MKAKSTNWVRIIFPLLLLILNICFTVPVIAKRRAKQQMVFERIDKACDWHERYLAVVDMIFSKRINIEEKKSRLRDMLTGHDIRLKYAAINALHGLISNHSRLLKDYSDIKDDVVENMLLMSKQYSSSESKDNDIKHKLYYSVDILGGLGVTPDELDDIRVNNDLPSFLRRSIESKTIELKYPEQHIRYQQALEGVKSDPIETNEWNRIAEFIEAQSPSESEDLYLWEHIDDWRESVLRNAIVAYEKMTPEVEVALWDYIKSALASNDDKQRDLGLMGCRHLTCNHFDEIGSIKDEMYALLSDYIDDCDGFSREQKCILILTKDLLAKQLYENGEITKDEFDRVSERCDKWLDGK